MKKRLTSFALLMLSLVTMVGCSASNQGASGSGASDSSKGGYAIGALWSTTSIPPVQVILKTAEAEAGKVNTKIANMDAQMDPQTQATQARNLITQKVDAVFVNVIDPEGIVPSLKEFHEANIPVIIGTLPVSKQGDPYITSFVGPNNIEAGKIAGGLMVEALGGSGGKIAIIEGAPGITVQDRTAGFLQGLEGKGVEVLDTQTSQWDRSRALSIMQDFLSKYPDLDGVFVHNDDMAMGAIQALKQAGKLSDVKVIGFGGTFEAVAAIEAGEMYGTVAEDLVWTAEKQVEVALAAIKGEQVDKLVEVPTFGLTKANLKDFTPTY